MSAYPARKLGAQPARNPWLHGSVLVGVALALVCIGFAPVRAVLGLVPLTPRELLLVFALLVVTWGSGELAARIARGFSRPPSISPAVSSFVGS